MSSDPMPAALPRRLLQTTLVFIIAFLGVTAGIIYYLWDRTTEPRIFFAPVVILAWGFVGGGIGVLHSLGFDRGGGRRGSELYAWVVTKPIIGAVMGGIVYFLAVSGELFLNGKTDIRNIELLNVLGFIAGFSDRFSIDLIDRISSEASRKRAAARTTKGGPDAR